MTLHSLEGNTTGLSVLESPRQDHRDNREYRERREISPRASGGLYTGALRVSRAQITA